MVYFLRLSDRVFFLSYYTPGIDTIDDLKKMVWERNLDKNLEGWRLPALCRLGLAITGISHSGMFRHG
jgi:hypothetical protein